MRNSRALRVRPNLRFRVTLLASIGIAALVVFIAGLAATPTSTATAPLVTGDAARYQNYTPNAPLGQSAGEPSIGVNPETGKVFFVARTQTLRVDFDDCSSPAKALWEDVTPPASSGASLDPILFTDQITGRTFTSQLLGKASELFYSDNDGQTWLPSQGAGINSGVDHQTIGGGPFAPGAPPHPLYETATYYCSQDAAVAQCALSLDGGQTFGPAIPIYNITQCAGIHGHVKVARDGTVYIPNKSCGGKQGVVVSENNGITWAVRTVPDSFFVNGIIDPSVGVGENGTLYFAYRQGGSEPGLGKAMVSVSQNKGVTWSPSVDVGAAFNLNNVTFPEAVAGDDDRAAVAFVGTPTDGDYQAPLSLDHDGNPVTAPIPNPTGFKGEWHMYIAHTFDRGATWTMLDATPTDPVQRNSICNSGTTCTNVPDDRNLLDFNDMTVDEEGRALVAYADGCVGAACIQGLDTDGDGFKQNDYTAVAKIARQSGGKRLFAEFDPDPAEPVAPEAPRVDSVTRSAPGTTAHLNWSEPDNGGSALTGYKIYRKDGAAPFALRATVTAGCPACTTTYDDSTATNTGITYLYKVTATNTLGESANCGEFPITLSGPVETACVVPGLTKLTDGAGDTSAALGLVSTPAPPGSDLLSFQLAQPYAPDGEIKLVITINTDPGQSPQPSGSAWYVAMQIGGSHKAVHMAWNPTSPTTPIFESYTPSTNLSGGTDGRFVEPGTEVPAEPESSYVAPFNKVVIVVKASDLGLDPGETITGFLVGVSQSTDPGGLVGAGGTALYDEMPNGLAFTGSYTMNSNEVCRPNAAPIPVLTATPQSGGAPLLVNFSGAGSFDPDTDAPADTIASYTFDFGDGSDAVTQANAFISHTYSNAGTFNASLRVTDSRGKLSDAVAGKVISVEGVSGTVNYALTSRGSTATASSTQTSRNYSTASAFDGDNTGVGWETGGGWNDNTRGLWPDNLDVTFGGGAKSISEIRVYTLQNNFSSPATPDENTDASVYGILDFQVQAWNGVAWITVPGGMITGNTKALRVITLATPISTTKVRVLVTNGRVHYSRIVELECYGAAGQ